MNSGSHSFEIVPEKVIDIGDVMRGTVPASGFKPSQCGSESLPKVFDGCCNNILVPDVKSNSGSNNTSEYSSFWSSNVHDDFWSFVGIIPSIWLMLWAANLNAPNVELTGRGPES